MRGSQKEFKSNWERTMLLKQGNGNDCIKEVADSMTKMRVHELAKELGMENKALIDALEKRQIEVKSHMSSLEESVVADLKKELGNKPKTEKGESVKENGGKEENNRSGVPSAKCKKCREKTCTSGAAPAGTGSKIGGSVRECSPAQTAGSRPQPTARSRTGKSGSSKDGKAAGSSNSSAGKQTAAQSESGF